MTQQLQRTDDQIETLQDACSPNGLDQVTDVCSGDNVGMTEEGELYFCTDDSNLDRIRKNLVLGFDGFTTHDLTEANKLIQEAKRIFPPDSIESFIRSRA